MFAYILIFTFKSTIAYFCMHCNWRAIVMLDLKAFAYLLFFIITINVYY